MAGAPSPSGDECEGSDGGLWFRDSSSDGPAVPYPHSLEHRHPSPEPHVIRQLGAGPFPVVEKLNMARGDRPKPHVQRLEPIAEQNLKLIRPYKAEHGKGSDTPIVMFSSFQVRQDQTGPS